MTSTGLSSYRVTKIPRLPGHRPNAIQTRTMRFIAFVRTNRHLAWDWDALAGNPNITIGEILSARDLPWSWSPKMKECVSRNPSVTRADINTMPDRFDAGALSSNPCITLADVCALPEMGWDWSALSARIPFQTIVARRDLPWVWDSVSSNPSVTLADVTAHLAAPWNWKNLSRTLNVTAEEIRSTSDLPWDFSYEGVWQNSNLSLREMRETFGRRGGGGPNPSAYLKVDVADIPVGYDGEGWQWEEDWDFPRMIENPSIPEKDISRIPGAFCWVMFEKMIATRKVSAELVHGLITGPTAVHIKMLSFNPHLPLSTVMSAPAGTPFSWAAISANPMGYAPPEPVIPSREEIRGRCVLVKGELMERTWHPDRVWNWCFDDEEKREIGGA